MLQYVFAIKVYFDIKKNQLETHMNPRNDKSYDLTTKQRFQQPHSGRASPGIVSEVTQDTARHRFSGLLLVTPCLLCMHISGKSIEVNQNIAEKYNWDYYHVAESDQRSINRFRISCLRFENLRHQISAQHGIDDIKKLAFAISEMR